MHFYRYVDKPAWKSSLWCPVIETYIVLLTLQETLAGVRNELECQRNENVEVRQKLTETSEDLSRTKNAFEETKGTCQVRFLSHIPLYSPYFIVF